VVGPSFPLVLHPLVVSGVPRLFVLSPRSTLLQGESLVVTAVVVSFKQPQPPPSVFWRFMGEGEYKELHMTLVAEGHGVWKLDLGSVSRTVEYFVEVGLDSREGVESMGVADSGSGNRSGAAPWQTAGGSFDGVSVTHEGKRFGSGQLSPGASPTNHDGITNSNDDTTGGARLVSSSPVVNRHSTILLWPADGGGGPHVCVVMALPSF